MSAHGAPLSSRRQSGGASWLRASGFVGAVLLVHVLGWGLFWVYSRRYPTLGGLGALAYTLGLRHAFDADHIAAIDNTTRKLLQDGKRPLGVGFFFSLGHSTVVFGLAALFALGIRGLGAAVGHSSSTLHQATGLIGPTVSGTFLFADRKSTRLNSSH